MGARYCLDGTLLGIMRYLLHEYSLPVIALWDFFLQMGCRRSNVRAPAGCCESRPENGPGLARPWPRLSLVLSGWRKNLNRQCASARVAQNVFEKHKKTKTARREE